MTKFVLYYNLNQQMINLPSSAKYIFNNLIRDENQENNEIRIKHYQTDQLFFNKSLKSPDFYNCLIIFKNIYIDIEYPSKLFMPISNLLIKIKNKNSLNIQIGIVFTSLPVSADSNCFSTFFSSCFRIDKYLNRFLKIYLAYKY